MSRDTHFLLGIVLCCVGLLCLLEAAYPDEQQHRVDALYRERDALRALLQEGVQAVRTGCDCPQERCSPELRRWADDAVRELWR